ncbi:hydroxymethylglutaryl-CoA synthase [Kribbella sp. NPDC051718]|uniref:hydroxymethylglutaryl-CoA synthase family protein n=1 Tax=Kribbella sp. NPDC051718 TaxID=3155168 RepID=UPI003427D7FC
MSVGIEAIGAYCGVARISSRLLFDARGLDSSRFDNLMADHRSVQMPWEDPVTNAVNAARPLLDSIGDAAKSRIELLVTSTESGLDYSKSVASYVHSALGLSRQCRILEVKQACYGATGALQLAAGHLAATGDPAARALVIATDVNPMDERARYAEPTTGHGAVALLVGSEPAGLVLERGAYGLCGFEVMDTARPLPDFDLYNTDLSLLTYLECLLESYAAYTEKLPGTDFGDSFDYVVMHTPFVGMVRAAHRKMMRESGVRSAATIESDFARRVAPSLGYARAVGNLCSGSVFLSLASLIDSQPPAVLAGARVGLFSYGSGCSSEFYSGVLAGDGGPRSGTSDLAEQLNRRRELSFPEYESLIELTRDCISARRQYRPDLSACGEVLGAYRADGPILVLKEIDEYHRKYEWW